MEPSTALNIIDVRHQPTGSVDVRQAPNRRRGPLLRQGVVEAGGARPTEEDYRDR